MFGSSPFPLPTIFNGIEVDMLSLGDADSRAVSHCDIKIPSFKASLRAIRSHYARSSGFVSPSQGSGGFDNAS
jgi:hypothetical protein